MRNRVNDSLKEHLNLANLPLATTDSGRRFVLKALHPSDHEIKSTQVPGGVNNSVTYDVDSVFTLPAMSMVDDDDTSAPIMMRLQASPIEPVTICANNLPPDGTLATSFGWDGPIPYAHFLVPQFAAGDNPVVWETSPGDGVRHADAAHLFTERFEQFRVTSESITVELVAPALSDQGTITAFQCTYPGYSIGFLAQTASSEPHTSQITQLVTMRDPTPTEDKALQTTRAYTSPAREGVYMPLRFSKFDYHTPGSLWRCVDGVFAHRNSSGVPDQKWEQPVASVNDVDTLGYRDLYGYDKNWYSPSSKCYMSPAGNTFGFVYIKGISVNASIRVRVRQTVEALVRPGTAYAAMALPPPPPDMTAINMYHEIAARMKDAYPARYNDWGQLKDAIKKIARNVIPFVSPALAAITKFVPGGGHINWIGQSALEGIGKWAGPSEQKVVQAAAQAAATAASKAVKQTQPNQRRPARRRRRNRPGQLPAAVIQAIARGMKGRGPAPVSYKRLPRSTSR